MFWIILSIVLFVLLALAVWTIIGALKTTWNYELTIADLTWQRNRANERRKRVERSLRRQHRKSETVVRNMAIRHGQVLGELEKAHEDLDKAEERYKTLAAQTVEGLLAHEEKQIMSLFHNIKETP
jgi:hypothetical protein